MGLIKIMLIQYCANPKNTENIRKYATYLKYATYGDGGSHCPATSALCLCPLMINFIHPTSPSNVSLSFYFQPQQPTSNVNSQIRLSLAIGYSSSPFVISTI